MSNILCAKVTGLSDGTNIYVIVLETAVLMVGGIVCFPVSMYHCNFYNYIYNILFISGKNSVRYYRKILGFSSKVRDSSSGYKQPSACR